MWFFLALFFALWTSIATSIWKRVLRDVSPAVMGGVAGIFVAPFLFLIILSTGGIPRVDEVFWLSAFMSGFLNVFASLASFTAIKHAPISLLAPMGSFNPVFTTLFAFMALSEVPSGLKVIGIVVVVVGSYLLNASEIKSSLFKPFIVLFSNRYVLLFLAANLIWAITPIFEKTAILHTHPRTPVFVPIISMLFAGILLAPVILKTVKDPLKEVKSNLHWFLLLAPFSALAAWAAFTAFSLTNVGYVTAIFKLSTLFTILWGGLLFKEERIKERFLGAAVMLLGTILLVI